MGDKAERLLQKARNSPTNWKRIELDGLYKAFNFIIENGSKHDIVKSNQYPDLRATLPRHNSVNKVYIKMAVELIDEMKLRNGDIK